MLLMEQLKWTLIAERKLLPPWIPVASNEPHFKYAVVPIDSPADPMQNVDSETEFYMKSISLPSSKSASNLLDDSDLRPTSSKLNQEKSSSMKRNYSSNSINGFIKSENRKIEQNRESMISSRQSDTIMEATSSMKTIMNFLYRKRSKIAPVNLESRKRSKSFSGSMNLTNEQITRRRRKSCGDGDEYSLSSKTNPLRKFERNSDEGKNLTIDTSNFLRQRSLSGSSYSNFTSTSTNDDDENIVLSLPSSKRRNSNSISRRVSSSKKHAERRPSSRDLNADKSPKSMQKVQRSNSKKSKNLYRPSSSSKSSSRSQDQKSSSHDQSKDDSSSLKTEIANTSTPNIRKPYNRYKYVSRYGIFHF